MTNIILTFKQMKVESVLDWKKRHNIIEGIAQGLVYLHKYSRLKVIYIET